jgi:hypothetical protein
MQQWICSTRYRYQYKKCRLDLKIQQRNRLTLIGAISKVQVKVQTLPENGPPTMGRFCPICTFHHYSASPPLKVHVDRFKPTTQLATGGGGGGWDTKILIQVW